MISARASDGYQRGLPQRVDAQVQALWATLAIDWQIGYINPPPAFSAASQRVRRPTEILGQGNGTCLDLALMLAACLEFIGLRPVLILSPGHAYAGWWRDEAATVEYIARRPPPAAAERGVPSGAPLVDEHGRRPFPPQRKFGLDDRQGQTWRCGRGGGTRRFGRG